MKTRSETGACYDTLSQAQGPSGSIKVWPGRIRFDHSKRKRARAASRSGAPQQSVTESSASSATADTAAKNAGRATDGGERRPIPALRIGSVIYVHAASLSLTLRHSIAHFRRSISYLSRAGGSNAGQALSVYTAFGCPSESCKSARASWRRYALSSREPSVGFILQRCGPFSTKRAARQLSILDFHNFACGQNKYINNQKYVKFMVNLKFFKCLLKIFKYQLNKFKEINRLIY